MKRTNSQLERAAMRIWRLRNSTDAEFWLIDGTCKCSWCRAKRAFRRACEDHVAKGRK